MSVKQTLIDARTLLASPENWTQLCDGSDGSEADLFDHGEPVDPKYNCFCLRGAIIKAAGPNAPTSRAAIKKLAELIDDPPGTRHDNSVMAWNDAPHRKHSEILDILDKAVEACP